MALRWAAAGMLEAKADFCRFKAHRQLPALRRALTEHQAHSPGKPDNLPALPTPIVLATVG